MENDKLFQNIKSAAESPAAPKFDSMDRVWDKVEAKLDNVELKKQTHRWKYLAIAASIMLVATLGYILSGDDAKTNPVIQIVATDTIRPTILPAPGEPKVAEIELSPDIKPDAEKILREKLTQAPVAAASEMTSQPLSPSGIENPNAEMASAPKFESRGVVQVPEQTIEVAQDVRTGNVAAKKPDPLVVVNGKAISKDQYDSTVKKELSSLSEEEVQDIVVLPDPLYIINGNHYTEQELFGANPSSPYAPLNKQEIEEISVLQGKQATDAYGDKGKKGVVIISTKNGKPAKKGR